MKIKEILLILSLFIICSCGNSNENKNGNGTNGSLKSKIFNPKDDLIGEYSVEPNGKAELRVTKKNGMYFVQIIQKGKWSELEQLNNVKNSEFQELFGDNWKDYGLAILDWTIG